MIVTGARRVIVFHRRCAELVPPGTWCAPAEEITALQNVTGEQRKNGFKSVRRHFEIEEVADEFPVIRMIKASCLEASQDPLRRDVLRFIMSFSELYYRSERFSYPETMAHTGVDTAGDKPSIFPPSTDSLGD